MIGNKKGSSTIESVIVIPLVITIVVVFIMLFISGYHYYADVLNGLYESILEEKSITVNGEFRMLTKTIDKSYSYIYQENQSKEIQNVVEYLLYIEKTYIGALNE